VYARLGRSEPALYHAARRLAYCESNPTSSRIGICRELLEADLATFD
jgi:hypothetical protein